MGSDTQFGNHYTGPNHSKCTSGSRRDTWEGIVSVFSLIAWDAPEKRCLTASLQTDFYLSSPRRRRSKRGRIMDADGMLEMFHCPYEGCTQVYVALSSFQVWLLPFQIKNYGPTWRKLENAEKAAVLFHLIGILLVGPVAFL